MSDFTKLQCVALVAKLSPQQVAVLQHMMVGRASKEIAAHLSLSENTVKVYRERIFSRLQVNNLAQAVRVATLAGVAVPQTPTP